MKFKITLKENGIHSLSKGLELFRKYSSSNKKNQYDLKDSILFIHHGIELLLKEILVNKVGEHIIFSRLDDSLFKKIEKSNLENKSIFDLPNSPNTISFLQAIQRIKSLLDEPKIDYNLEKALLKLNTFRNNLQHYGIDKSFEEIVTFLSPINMHISKYLNSHGIELGESINSLINNLENELIREVYRLMGSPFIQNFDVQGSTLTIKYYLSYEDYEKNKGASKIDGKSFKAYWNTGKAIEKMIVEPIRMMKNFDYLDCVKITYGDGIKKYTLEVFKDEFENEIEFSIQELKESKNWKIFVNKYIYRINNPLRDELFNKFVINEDISNQSFS